MEKITELDWPDAFNPSQAELAAAVQAELAIAVDELTNATRRVALRAKLTIAIDDATEVQRAAEALRTAVWSAESVEPQLAVEHN